VSELVVERNVSKLPCQPENHVPIKEGPAPITVEQKQDRAVPFVNVVDSVAVDVDPTVLEWVECAVEPRRDDILNCRLDRHL
jgi:hypothetical protein